MSLQSRSIYLSALISIWCLSPWTRSGDILHTTLPTTTQVIVHPASSSSTYPQLKDSDSDSDVGETMSELIPRWPKTITKRISS